jgi:predicted PurR-regulated permease PerM
MSEPKPKKMVRRSIAVALGIVFIVLIAGLGGAIAYYTMRNNSLQNQVNDLTNTLNLGKSTVWVNSQTISQDANSYYWWNSPFYPWNLNYCGYISVQVLSSTTSNTYVRVIYTVHGINYDNQINVGSMGTAVFPVLPTSIEIRVGNTNFFNGATETVTITYYY